MSEAALVPSAVRPVLGVAVRVDVDAETGPGTKDWVRVRLGIVRLAGAVIVRVLSSATVDRSVALACPAESVAPVG